MSIYDNGKIYKLVNNVDDKIYVGSTCNLLRVRIAKNKSSSKLEPDRSIDKHVNQVGWGNVEIILIQKYECKSKEDLNKRERYWIDELKPDLNIQIPTRTPKEWYEENKEYVMEKTKKYAEEHKENVIKYKKKYSEKNKEKINEKIICECGAVINKKHKAIHLKTMKHKQIMKINE